MLNKLKAMARLEEHASYMQAALKSLMAMFIQAGVPVENHAAKINDHLGAINLSMNLRKNQWQTWMDRLGFVNQGRFYTLPNDRHVHLSLSPKGDCIEVELQ